MDLFFTDASFVVEGVPRPDIPFLCNDEMELVVPANRWLRHVAIIKGRTRSRQTWRTYGGNLYEFFAFLEANGLQWDQVNQSQIAAWRDAMLARGCKRSTVNQRLGTVDMFYEWQMREGITHTLPFNREDVWVAKARGTLERPDASGGRFAANEAKLKTFEAMPRFLHLSKAVEFCESLSPVRLKLMGYQSLLTGMRREEVVGFDVRAFPNPAGCDPSKSVPMFLDPDLTPTKGHKERMVMIPYDLALAMSHYLTFVRPKLAALHRKQFGKDTTRFYLSRTGEELAVKGVNNAFTKHGIKIGFHVHPHLLRHTFCTYELVRVSKKEGETKALLWVAERAGHSSLETTRNYIHACDLIKNDLDAVDGYQEEVCRKLRHGN
jgi:site-specific recombinase XerD